MIFLIILFSISSQAQSTKKYFGRSHTSYFLAEPALNFEFGCGEAHVNQLLHVNKKGELYFPVIGNLFVSKRSKDAENNSINIPPPHKYSKAVEDNSFLIEEAYNQEEGVVQHISHAVYFREPERNIFYSFTQEWPIGGLLHQLSFTIPYSFLNSNKGVGDLMFNYRYQLFTSDDWAAFSPRISIIVPTGNVSKSLGAGSIGMQINLPASKRFSEFFVGHFNAGFTFMPSAQVSFSNKRHQLTFWNLGGSIIWLAGERFNVMMEYLINDGSNIDEFGNVNRFTEKFISPGIRYAIDIGELQIVPGLAFPFSFLNEDNRVGMIFYLSFEHTF